MLPIIFYKLLINEKIYGHHNVAFILSNLIIFSKTSKTIKTIVSFDVKDLKMGKIILKFSFI